jgi:glycosyltransferase involved in cell wall biosynthesis
MSSSNRRKVVACLPTWNAESFVGETLRSLAAQTYPNLEILISDDASTDQTVAVCERLVSSDRRFRIIRQRSTRRGWLENSNLLLNAAKGDYLFFAFHDDLLQPTYVARLVEALETNAEAVLAFTDIYHDPSLLYGRTKNGTAKLRIDDDGSCEQIDCYCELEGVSSRVERARRILHKRGLWWIPHNGLFRSTAVRRVGGMRRHLGGDYKADWPWLLHFSLLGEFVRVPEPLLLKSWRSDSVSARWVRESSMWKSAAVLLACAREVCLARLSLMEQVQIQGSLAFLWASQFACSQRLPWRNS